MFEVLLPGKHEFSINCPELIKLVILQTWIKKKTLNDFFFNFQTYGVNQLSRDHQLSDSQFVPFTPLSEPQQWENMVVIYLNLLNSNNFIYLCCINSKINQNWRRKRNRVFATNSDFLIPISLKSDDVNLWYFKLSLFDQ